MELGEQSRTHHADQHGSSLRFRDVVLLVIAFGGIAWVAGQASSPLDGEKPLFKYVPAASDDELTPVGSMRLDRMGWMRSNGDDGNSRFSSYDQVNRSNVSRLEVAWTYRSGDGRANVQANPVFGDGLLYMPTAGKNIVAIDAASGKEVWRYRPSPSNPSGYGPATRGLTYSPGANPRLYFMSNGYLYALEAATGKPVTSFGQRGKTVAYKGAGKSQFLGTGAPLVYGKTVIISNQNYVEAFDVSTGARRWAFNTITYAVADPDSDNGGNVWGGLALDGQRGLIFAAVGDPHPNFVGTNRPGANRHTNSVIALDARTGKLVWSFQDIAHSLWDVDTAAPPNLVTVRRGGKYYDAVAEVTKSGNTLLLDRRNGKPLFRFRLRRAPPSTLPGERTAEYQPDLELPAPFVRQKFTLREVTDISPAARQAVMRRIRHAKFGWFAPFEEGRPTIIFPGTAGGAEWTGASFDPVRRLLYVTANELPTIVTLSRAADSEPARVSHSTAGARLFDRHCAVCHGKSRQGQGMAPSLINIRTRYSVDQIAGIIQSGRGGMPALDLPPSERKQIAQDLTEVGPSSSGKSLSPTYVSDGFNKLYDDEGYPGVRPPWGTLTAISVDTGHIIWQVPLGEYPKLVSRGIMKTGATNFGGAMSTAGGLIFAAGTPDLLIRAFDQTNGRELWRHALPYGGYAPPMTYMVNGTQFIVIIATGGGKLGTASGDAVIAFRLRHTSK